MGPPRKISKILTFFGFSRPTQKIGREGPKWGGDASFRHKKNLADILGRTDFDFENFYFLIFVGVPNFGLGPTWAPRGLTHVGPTWVHPRGPLWAPRGATHLGPTWAHPLGGPSGGPLGWALELELLAQCLPSQHNAETQESSSCKLTKR